MSKMGEVYTQIAELAGLDATDEKALDVVAEAFAESSTAANVADIAHLAQKIVERQFRSVRKQIVDFGTKGNLAGLTVDERFIFGNIRTLSHDIEDWLDNPNDYSSKLGTQLILDYTELFVSKLDAIAHLQYVPTEAGLKEAGR